MPLFRSFRRPWALLASFVLLASALLPLLAQAVSAATGQQWVEVCTTQGMKRVAVAADEVVEAAGERSDDAGPSGAHCPWCSLGTHATGLPPRPPVVLLPAEPAQRLFPERYDSAARTLHAWCTAQPRAPPARS